MKESHIAVIGAGVVGATTAYALMLKNVASKITLVDIQDIKCKGEVEDLSDVLSFSNTSEIVMGTLKDAGQADIAIITAGIAQKPGQSRTELLKTNYAVIQNVIQGMQPLHKDLIIIVVTNPVDVLTYWVQKFSQLPKNQIFGSGTLLDSQRLRENIGKVVGVAQQSVHIYVLGEHGDSQFVAWSSGMIAGVPLATFKECEQKALEKMAEKSMRKAYDIIECKGSTAFGVASCVTAYCQNIVFDTKRVLPVSCYLEKYDVCVSMPVVMGLGGVERIIEPSLNEQEKEYLKRSINNVKFSLQLCN